MQSYDAGPTGTDTNAIGIIEETIGANFDLV